MANRKTISKRTRFSVFDRDGFTCVYCGRQPPVVVLQIEHVIPVSKGGTNDEGNLRTACVDCNLGKAAKSIGDSVPTESDRLRQAQELAETIHRAEQLLAAQKANDEYRQLIVNRVCELLGQETCNKATVTFIRNLIDEFGAARVDEWMQYTVTKVFGETKFAKYMAGIARNVREGGE